MPGITLTDLKKGYKVYTINCSGCHRLHDTKEYNDVQWKEILPEMITRAKLSNGKEKESYIINELLRDTKAEFHSIEAGEITDGINWFVNRSKLDWLVVIPKKHHWMEKLFRRSQTKELVYHTHIPILCIHE